VLGDHPFFVTPNRDANTAAVIIIIIVIIDIQSRFLGF
jgi:hypothetical protein